MRWVFSVVLICMGRVCVRARADRTVEVRHLVAGIRPLALVVSGQALTHIFADDRLQFQFLSLSMASAAVLACRVSPPQKASIVRMVSGRLVSRKHVC